MAGEAIRLDGAGVRIGSRWALRDVSLSIAAGEQVAILGANGAGKSTLLRVLGGRLPVSEGRVTWASRGRAGAAMIWQGIHLVQRLTVLENVLVGALARYRSPFGWLRRFPAPERRRATSLLERLGIGHLAGERAGRLSGGEKQRVAIARALMQDAGVLLADEPTASLDWGASRQVAAHLSQAARAEGRTLLVVMHDLQLVEELAARVIVLGAGRVAYDGPWDARRREWIEEQLGARARRESAA